MESYFKITKLTDEQVMVDIQNLSTDDVKKIGIQLGLEISEILNSNEEDKNIITAYRFFTKFALTYLFTVLKCAPKKLNNLILKKIRNMLTKEKDNIL